MYPGTDRHPALAALAVSQLGVLRKSQLAAVGLPHKFAFRQVDAARWSEWGNNVLLLSNAPPTREQLKRIALLDPSGLTALASHTALEHGGFRSFAQEASDVHLLVVRGATYAELPGVVHHESRRLEPPDVVNTRGLRTTRHPRSAIDSGAWQPWPRFACAMLGAVVQQGMCTPRQLDQAFAVVGRVRHKQHMRLALKDIAAGAHALGEIDAASLCRRHHLRPPDRQKARRDPTGRLRYLDCEWDLEDGSIVVLEVDGSHHFDVEHWEADMKRERKVVISRRWVLRASNYEVRHEHADVARDLIAMGVPVVREA
ncbi:MAG: hypothetical protein ABJA81_02225 [Nocardioidaceae bacterium]